MKSLLLAALLLVLRMESGVSFTTSIHAPVSASAWSSQQSRVAAQSFTFAAVRPSSSLQQLHAKKRRRRRKDGADNDSDDDGDNELPDFDISEDKEESAAAKPTRSKKKSSSSPPAVITTTPEGEPITAAMMGGPGQAQAKSVNDLIKDRSLEQKLEFDDLDNDENNNNNNKKEELPDLIQMARQENNNAVVAGGEGGGMSKKKARQAARQAAAAAREQQDQESSSSLDSIIKNQFPQLLNEKGQVSGVKILEAGTWAGIFVLVGWEVYINSPLFDRAAPLSPVVF